MLVGISGSTKYQEMYDVLKGNEQHEIKEIKEYIFSSIA